MAIQFHAVLCLVAQRKGMVITWITKISRCRRVFLKFALLADIKIPRAIGAFMTRTVQITGNGTAASGHIEQVNEHETVRLHKGRFALDHQDNVQR